MPARSGREIASSDFVSETPPRRADPASLSFQFRLRTLLVLVAAAAVLSAVMAHVGPLWSTLLVFCGLLIVAHVAGNACGTHNTESAPPRKSPLMTTARLGLRLRTTLLRERHGPGWLVGLGIAVGALVGGLVGTTVLWFVYWGPFGAGPVGVGGVSSAVVGGFLGFLVASFVEIGGRAWRQASGEFRRR